ncbi:MAG: IS1595 family transposase, partial [Candidatus Kapaibacterium sp.]
SHEACIRHLEAVRWNGTPVCPYCKSTNTSPAPKELRHHCNNCNTTFSVTVGTIFHKTKMDLQKWFVAVSIILNAKKGISARQLGRDLEINKDTAWYMAMRIRRAMVEQGALLEGIVEVDETYVGGKPRKGVISNPNNKGTGNKRGMGTKKIPVMGAVERGGRVKAKVVRHTNAATMERMVRESIAPGKCRVFTDEHKGYTNLSNFVEHETINHKYEYVNGEVHTNTIEGFWALIKRGIVGQYHHVAVRHLNKYLNEFCFRYNNRNNTGMLFDLTISKALGVTA